MNKNTLRYKQQSAGSRGERGRGGEGTVGKGSQIHGGGRKLNFGWGKQSRVPGCQIIIL